MSNKTLIKKSLAATGQKMKLLTLYNLKKYPLTAVVLHVHALYTQEYMSGIFNLVQKY